MQYHFLADLLNKFHTSSELIQFTAILVCGVSIITSAVCVVYGVVIVVRSVMQRYGAGTESNKGIKDSGLENMATQIDQVVYDLIIGYETGSYTSAKDAAYLGIIMQRLKEALVVVEFVREEGESR